VYRLTAASGPGSEAGAGERKWGRLWAFVRVLLVWGGVLAVVFVVLWPAMWVEPLDVMRRIINWAFFHVETAHQNPIFFNGQVFYEDPGIQFYLATIVWKMTVLTLPMAGAALAFALPRLRRGNRNRNDMVWLLVVYAVGFTIQMSLGGWKQVSYMAPVFPALDIVATFGLVQSAEAIARIRWWHKWRWLPPTFIVSALALQAGVVLPHHPYYGTHHNALLGGSRTAQRILPLQDQGEGLDLAAQYLNTLPRAQRASAWLYHRSAAIFRRNFVGVTDTGSDPQVSNYRVYYVNQVMRRLGYEEWGEMWDADRQTTPLWSVTFDGVTYVWIYGDPPGELALGGPEWEVDYQLGEHIWLERVRLSAEKLSPGETLTAVLYWRSDGQVETDYHVFCHVLTEDGELVSQQDGVPIAGIRPTSTWREGEVIEDSYEIILGADLAVGRYELSVGMYDFESMERLRVFGPDDARLPDDRIALGWVSIEENPSQ